MTEAPKLSDRRSFTSRSEFRDLIVTTVAAAAVDGRREIIWVDTDFAEWPLDDARLLDALGRWAKRPERRFLMVARHFDEVPRRHPRFTQWRRWFAHRIECRSAPDVSEQEMPTLMMAGELYNLQLLDKRRWHGRWLDDETDAKAWREVVDAILQRSSDDFAANTLGL